MKLRVVNKADIGLLFRWVNQPESLNNKLKTKKRISWKDHNKWFNRMRQSGNTAVYIIHLEETDVGQIRLIFTKNQAEIDIYIDSAYRRRGIAQQALTLVLSQCPKIISAFIATVRRKNSASLKLFKRMGFRPVDCKKDFYVLKKKLTI